MKPSYERPAIEASGLPPERHADRMVALMLRYLINEHAGAFRRVVAAIRPAGSPKAQAHLLAAIRKACGQTLIESKLRSGTRGRFRIDLVDWCAWDEIHNHEIEPGDVIPPKPWIACRWNIIEGRCPTLLRPSYHLCLLITHHAFSRLAQRCGARTTDDLIAATRKLWLAHFDYIMNNQCKRIPDDTRIPVEGLCTAVIRDHRIVTTILPPEKGAAFDAP